MRRRGFTVMELSLVIAIVGVIAAAAGAFYLEMRVGFARSETNVVLTREASLLAESIGRDLRSARNVRNSGERAIEIDQGDKTIVRYLVESTGGVIRDDGEERLRIARFVGALSVHQESEGFALRIEMERELLPGRTVKMAREAFVGARRK